MQSYDICIVGCGLAGLSTAAFLLKKRPQARIILLEKNTTAGGAIKSFQQDGYLAEWGPHGFLDNCAESRELIEFADLEHEQQKAPLGDFVRYICLNGALQEIAQKPLKLITRPHLSIPAKIRVLGDLFKKPLAGEPSVAQWVEHRFGQALLPFADAAFTGTYAGDIFQLKIDAVMPGIREIEQLYGNVIGGLLRHMWKKRKKTGGKKGLPSMVSFQQGMGQLPLALADKLERQAELCYEAPVSGIRKSKHGWQIDYENSVCTADHLVLALPVNASLRLLEKMENIPAPPVQKIPEAKLASVLMGFDKSAAIPFGFGYLAPEQENRFCLGTLFSSHMFPQRAPEGGQLVEVLIGGRRHEKRLACSDTELINGAYRDLRELIYLPKAPVFKKVLRPSAGLPQLESGHTELLQWRSRILQDNPQLSICGFGWKGIGINDITKETKKTVGHILSRQLQQKEVEIKKVYF